MVKIQRKLHGYFAHKRYDISKIEQVSTHRMNEITWLVAIITPVFSLNLNNNHKRFNINRIFFVTRNDGLL